jgi:hypothetical protein
MMPLAIDLDGLDLFGDLRTPLMGIAVMLALLLGAALVAHLRAPDDLRIHKRAGR